jgi:Zn-dependent peptidase ImmA (M78 family)/DNA-binding XRE family transcriptional regulator
MKKDKKFLGDKLRLIRLFYNLSQEEVGERVMSSRQYIQQLETGIKLPSEDFVAALSDALDVNFSFFFEALESEIREEQCHFRKQSTTPSNTIRQVISHATLYELVISTIDKKLNLPEVNFPNKVPSCLVDIENIAEECRRHWKLGLDTPIKNMMRVVENAGAVVTYFKTSSTKLDALSINRARPIIILSDDKEESPARIRFDLAHECGHLVMHQGIETGDHKTEEEANRFASAFLLPRRAFVNEFPKSSRLSWNEIYKMKLRWKTSAKAIIRRASDLRLIDSIQYRRANIYFTKSGQIKFENHDNELEKEPPELFKIALEALESAFDITLNDLGKKLYLGSNTVSKLTGYSANIKNYRNITNIEKYKFINS